MRFLLLNVLCWLPLLLPAQNLPFQNLNLEEGLIQSQVISIAQDKQKQLWITTNGGVTCFDGLRFKTFGAKDGFPLSVHSKVFVSRNGEVWLSNLGGISVYNGHHFKHFKFTTKGQKFVNELAEDRDGNLYALVNREEIFQVSHQKILQVPKPPGAGMPTLITTSFEGVLMAYFLNFGLALYDGKQWKKTGIINSLDRKDCAYLVTKAGAHYYFITRSAKLIKSDSHHQVFEKNLQTDYIRSCNTDLNGNIWLGTINGIHVYDSTFNPVTIIDQSNGLANTAVTTIFKDVDNTLWIGTDGNGLFKYTYGAFLNYSKTTGLPGEIAMGFARGRGENIFVGLREGYFLEYEKASRTFRQLSYSHISRAGVNTVGNGHDGSVYAGLLDGRILSMKGNVFAEFKLDPRFRSMTLSITYDSVATYFATGMGCFIYSGDSVRKIPGIEGLCYQARRLANGELLVAATNGTYILNRAQQLRKIPLPRQVTTEVVCTAESGPYILLGTLGSGLVVWNRESGKQILVDTDSGLDNNSVYALYNDGKGSVWISTGSGLQKLTLGKQEERFRMQRFSASEGYRKSESNLNAIIETSDGQLWFGTTNGIFIYRQRKNKPGTFKPYMIMSKVETSGYKVPPDSSLPWSRLPLNPVLEYKNNSISIHFNGVSPANPEGMMYSYKLLGFDEKFSAPTSENFVSYRNLEPGNYTFQVKSIANAPLLESNIAEYSFSIAAPFYKTVYFRVLIISLLVVLGMLMQFYAHKAKQRRFHQLVAARAAEQERVRRQTSEDFHDDLGNRLTRLSVLTEILQSKVEKDQPEVTTIIGQLKENISALYEGAREIIWSLAPENNKLKIVVEAIVHNGSELFEKTQTAFSVTGLDSIPNGVNLPVGYGRNLLLIYKELFNNIVRHSGARHVCLKIEYAHPEIIISCEDDGKGFDQGTAHVGNGLINIQNRVARIDGVFEVKNAEGHSGSLALLKLDIERNT